LKFDNALLVVCFVPDRQDSTLWKYYLGVFISGEYFRFYND